MWNITGGETVDAVGIGVKRPEGFLEEILLRGLPFGTVFGIS
jgi:hypothetical protein